jgi:phage gp46-like protein
MGIDVDLTSDYDIQVGSDGDIVTKDFFDTAILMSLFCERRAGPSEVPESHRRRGWIGNESTPGFEIGSKVWLYEQERVTRSIFNLLSQEAFNAFEWFIDDGFVISIKTNVGLNNGSVELTVEFKRSGAKVETKNYTLWENTGNKAYN